MLRALALVLALSAAGCVTPEDVPSFLRRSSAEPSAWAYVEEPAMAPDFTGLGASYPVLLIHSHHVPSARQQEEARRNPVVCLDLDGAPLPFAARDERDMAASAPCMGPAADPATGRLRVDRQAFDEARPRAVAVLMGSCSGGAIYLDAARDAFLVSTRGHDFQVRALPNGTFTVDDTWLRPGTALKVAYYLHRGDAEDEEYVRVVFEAPGEWLVSRVGMQDPGPPLPPRPDQGTGLVVDVPLSPATLAGPVMAALAATPGTPVGLAQLRAVHDGERLTELTVRVVTEEGAVTWYGAGRTRDALRLLGAEDAGGDEAVAAIDALAPLVEREWDALRGGAVGTTLDARLAPDVAWSTRGLLALASPVDEPLPCEGDCVYVRQADRWAQLLAPEATASQAAATLAVQTLADDGATTQVWWHAPHGSTLSSPP